MGAWALATIAFLVLSFAAASGRLERSLITPAIFFTSAGLIAGPGLGLIELHIGGEPVKLLAEATLTLVLFADASRISLRTLRVEYAVPLRLLGIGLPLTILAGALAGIAVLPDLQVAEALVLAVTLACTDAALGQAVVTDPRLPSRIRQGLNVESGLNDGICVPLFFIAISIAEADASELSAHAAWSLVAHQIGYGLVAGVASGVFAAAVERLAVTRRMVEPLWLQVVTFAAAILAAGIAVGLGGSIFIAAFAGGLVFGALRHATGGEVAYLVDQNSQLLNAATFIVFGAVVLSPALRDITARLALYVVLSLTVVRMLPVALAMLGSGARGRTLVFLGWSGPRGLASIVFAVLLTHEAHLPGEHDILVAIALTVALSIYAHGITAQPLTDRYVRWYQAHAAEELPAMESRPAPDHRLRGPLAAAASPTASHTSSR
jgi:NhaP-type Na+/H+ or K+/H+ antiporter